MQNYFYSNTTKTSFLKYLKHKIRTSDKILISVSFIKKAGLSLLEDDFIYALNKGSEIKIITSTYQNFTDVQSLNVFLKLNETYHNFKCHLDYNTYIDGGFHTKAYFFETNDTYELAIGSSNITLFALRKNVEWNLLVASSYKNEAYNDAEKAFYEVWGKTKELTNDLVLEYKNHLEYSIEKWDMDYFQVYKDIQPNYMQRRALKELQRYRDMDVKRALVVAATGSGKTHLAAFDARNFDAQKILFVVHRENILIEAQKVFRHILGTHLSYGLLTGNTKEHHCDVLFATNITISKNLETYEQKAFDYIILDEVHHAAAGTYQKIINYFKPLFMLGLTATPERMDDQSAIYDIFEQNVPFDLRLRDAIINDLIVPFHYYGIRNHLVNYNQKETKILLKEMTDHQNVEFIAEELEKHRPSGKLKAIAFCIDVNHAKSMSERMQSIGYQTIYLVGHHSIGERIQSFNDLQDDEKKLEIIFTVDILNEGVDLPSVNTVLFLRPTESSIVFLQQLGRGLRKYKDKKHLTVLDFIGNSYKRSVEIVRALSTLSRNEIIEKKFLIDMIRDDFKAIDIPGVQIHIDALSKEEIIEYVRKENFNLRKYLEADYFNFKRYIKATPYPSHMDFYHNEFAPNLIRFIQSKMDSKKNESYYTFLQKIGEIVPDFDEKQISLITFLSSNLPIVRLEDFEIISHALSNERITMETFRTYFYSKHGFFRENHARNAFKYILNYKGNSKESFFIKDENQFKLEINKKDLVFESFIEDIINYGIARYDDEFKDHQDDLKLYATYFTEQFMMATCQDTIYVYPKGTKIEKDGTVYVLINLKKEESIAETLKYNDRFINDHVLQWESETNTTFEKDRGLIKAKVVHVFVRKFKEEDGITLPYTYIGTGHFKNPRVSENPGKTLLFDIYLDNKVPSYLKYDFHIVEGTHEKNN